jgi:hypothetical protein
MKNNLKVGDKVKCFGLSLDSIPWWELAYLKPKWMLSDFAYWCKKQYQRVRYGFPLEESWDFKSHCAKWVLPRLKKLREDAMSYPSCLSNSDETSLGQIYFSFYKDLSKCDSETQEYGAIKWNDILDKIIWSFEHLDDYIEPIYPEKYDHRQIVVEISEKVTSFKPADDRKIDWSPIETHQKRLQEGFELFGKYYGHLWS